MAQATSVSRAVTGAEDKIMSFETGKLAGLADGAVMGRLGDTMVLVTATASRRVREGADFFPLTVDVEEKMYAAGKIPGSFFRREARAGEAAILTCRLADRPLRPAFPDGFRNEVHIVATVMGADQENPYDVLTINAASAALMISPIPFDGPIGACRIAYDATGNWIPHPTYEEGSDSVFEMVVAGRELEDGDIAVMMVEAGGTESTWEHFESGEAKVDEAVLADGLTACKVWIKEAIALQRELIDAVGGKPEVFEFTPAVDYSPEIMDAVMAAGSEQINATQQIADKADRTAAEDVTKADIIAAVLPQFAEVDSAEQQIKNAIRSATKAAVRKRIVEDGVRIDGRGLADLRPLEAEVDVIPTAHGTGMFKRGDTQVLNFTTLGMKRMDQMVDGIDPVTRKRYMHHYNFPPFSTGETGFMRGPKRREIGHGALAERALFPVVPSIEEFPYTLRLVSEVLGSNGSSSMASVCSSSLSLMDAGVPIKAAVAGIAMGLVYAEGKYTTLTDILGAEDAFGDMDFKVAGTADFITALQLDTKIDGIPSDVLAAALNQAKDARTEILAVMAAAIAEPRPEVGPTAPKIVSFEIPIDKIGEVIGPKGKVINAIQAETGADISVDDDGAVGIVAIASNNKAIVEEAERQINLILDPPTAEVGATYTGRVVNITKFGAFVNILPGRDGLVHISKLGKGKRIDKVEDVVSLGDEIEVTVEDVDPNGKVSLTPAGYEAPAGGGDRDRGGSDRGDRGGSDRGGRGRDNDRGGSRGRDRDRGGSDRGDRGGSDRGDRGGSDRGGSDRGGSDESSGSSDGDSNRAAVSFEDTFEAEVREQQGDLGPDTRGGGGRGRGGRSRR